MSISSIVYGINDVADVSSSIPQFTADKARVGWNYQATNPTDNIALTIFSEDGLTNTNNLFNVTVRGAVGNTTYANIPYLSIKTKPKGDGSDFDPSFHSQQILKIADNNFVSSDELVYFYYKNLVPQLDEFKKAEYKLVTTNGTLDPLNPILTIELISNNSSTTSFYLQNTEVISKNHLHKFNRIIEYRNKDSSLILPTGAATEAKQDDIISELTLILDQDTVTASNTSSINNKISKGNDFTLTEAQQVLVYGEVTNGPSAGELHPIHITNSGDVEVEIADFVKGQDVMADSFPVVIASDQSTLTVSETFLRATQTLDFTVAAGSNNTSSGINMSPGGNPTYRKVAIFGNTDNVTDMEIYLQFSNDNLTWCTAGEDEQILLNIDPLDATKQIFYKVIDSPPQWIRLLKLNSTLSLETLTVKSSKIN